MDGLEAYAGSGRESDRLPWNQALSGRPADRKARTDAGAAVTATVALDASARPLTAGAGRDGHLCRHHPAMDERQAHPKRQYERQVQPSDAIPGPAFHRAPKMA